MRLTPKIHLNLEKNSKADYLLNIQAALLSNLATRVVIPLYALDNRVPIEILNPIVKIRGCEFLASTQEIFTIAEEQLGPVVRKYELNVDDIEAAIMFMFKGL